MKIRDIRESRGMTQRALAVKAGLSPVYLCNVEGGKANVSLFTLRRLAKVLKVKVSDLVADE